MVVGEQLADWHRNRRLIGVRALPVVSPKRQPFDLSFQGKSLHLSPAGTVQTGAAEDSRIYLFARRLQSLDRRSSIDD